MRRSDIQNHRSIGWNMQIAHLETFLAVAQEGSFADAARRLWVAPSRVTERIQQLEQELGCTLIDRSKRSLAVTQAGTALLPRAQGIVRELEAIRTLFPGDEDQGITVGMRTLPADYIDRVRTLITGAGRTRATTILPLDTATQIQLLQTGRLDFGFLWTPPPAPLRSVPVLVEELVAGLPNTSRFATLDIVSPKDLAGLKLASTIDPLTVPTHLGPYLEYLPRVDIVNAAVGGALTMLIASGRYCTLVPRGLLATDAPQGSAGNTILIRPLLPPSPAITTHFAWRPDLEQIAPFSAVIETMRRAFATPEQR